MPRHPQIGDSLSAVGGSPYSAVRERIAAFRGRVAPLNVGDTWLEPAAGCRMQDLTVEDHPGLHRYAEPRGLAGLLEAIAERTRDRTGVATGPDDVLVTAGATGGLGAVLGAILDPGDRVLVLSPYWPLITGIVRCFRGEPDEVPLPAPGAGHDAVVAALEARRGPRTVAVYLSTPNNPTGRVLAPEVVEDVVRWAARHDLWVLADEVYEDYVFRGEHRYARPLAPERTFSAHSFSKAFGMAGNRCGYVVGPRDAMPSLRKVSTHAWYSTPTAAQIAALIALDGRGDAWVADARERYRDLGDAAAHRLGVPEPEGSTFLFIDVADRLDDRGLPGFLEDCADRGLLVAPGPSFGSWPTHVRICFTSAEPDLVRHGVDVLASLLGR